MNCPHCGNHITLAMLAAQEQPGQVIPGTAPTTRQPVAQVQQQGGPLDHLVQEGFAMPTPVAPDGRGISAHEIKQAQNAWQEALTEGEDETVADMGDESIFYYTWDT